MRDQAQEVRADRELEEAQRPGCVDHGLPPRCLLKDYGLAVCESLRMLSHTVGCHDDEACLAAKG
jgi:hypothetical protein